MNISDISFDGIKTSLKSYLSSLPEYTDYNFEGSNLAYLIDFLSFITFINLVHQSLGYSENFIKTANIYENILALAKRTGYYQQSCIAHSLYVSLELSSTSLLTSLELPRGSIFSVSFGNNQSYFNLVDGIILNDGFVSTVELRQGIHVTKTLVYDGTPIILPEKNIDHSLILAYVNNAKLNLITDVFAATSNGYYAILETTGTYQNQIRFDEIISNVNIGDTIYLDYFVSDVATSIFQQEVSGCIFTSSGITGDVINYNNNLTIIPAAYITLGSDIEDIESVRINADKSFRTQNRCVGIKDYSDILDLKYPFIQYINTYDLNNKDDVYLSDFGKLNFSVVPTNYKIIPYLNSTQINNCISGITKEYSVFGIELDYVDPVYIAINQQIAYTLKRDSVKSELQLANDLKLAFNSLIESKYTTFNTLVPLSLISKDIQTSVSDTAGCDLSLTYSIELDLARYDSNLIDVSFDIFNDIDLSNISIQHITPSPITFLINNNIGIYGQNSSVGIRDKFNQLDFSSINSIVYFRIDKTEIPTGIIKITFKLTQNYINLINNCILIPGTTAVSFSRV